MRPYCKQFFITFFILFQWLALLLSKYLSVEVTTLLARQTLWIWVLYVTHALLVRSYLEESPIQHRRWINSTYERIFLCELNEWRSCGLQMFKSAPQQTPRLVSAPLMFRDDGSSARELGYWAKGLWRNEGLSSSALEAVIIKESLQLDPSWIVVWPRGFFHCEIPPGTMVPSSTSTSVCKVSQRPVTFIFSSLN